MFNEYLYNFIHTSGFGEAYKTYIDVKNISGVVDVSCLASLILVQIHMHIPV